MIRLTTMILPGAVLVAALADLGLPTARWLFDQMLFAVIAAALAATALCIWALVIGLLWRPRPSSRNATSADQLDRCSFKAGSWRARDT